MLPRACHRPMLPSLLCRALLRCSSSSSSPMSLPREAGRAAVRRPPALPALTAGTPSWHRRLFPLTGLAGRRVQSCVQCSTTIRRTSRTMPRPSPHRVEPQFKSAAGTSTTTRFSASVPRSMETSVGALARSRSLALVDQSLPRPSLASRRSSLPLGRSLPSVVAAVPRRTRDPRGMLLEPPPRRHRFKKNLAT